MDKAVSNSYVILKEYINEKDYEDIKELEKICSSNDTVSLKLELDFRMSFPRKNHGLMNNISEFLYYIDNTLAGYLGISSFGGNIGELNGAVHPKWRRRGIFKRLYSLAIDESRKRNFSKILLLSDDKSATGTNFINLTGAKYSFSECRMKLAEFPKFEGTEAVTLRKALNSDAEEIRRQNCIYFGDGRNELILPEEEEKSGRTTYMAELDGKIIGKIRIETNEPSAFISGVGILPEYRGKGYGKETLKEALRIIKEKGIAGAALDVAAENKNAFRLYKSCGFAEESVMNYYEIK